LREREVRASVSRCARASARFGSLGRLQRAVGELRRKREANARAPAPRPIRWVRAGRAAAYRQAAARRDVGSAPPLPPSEQRNASTQLCARPSRSSTPSASLLCVRLTPCPSAEGRVRGAVRLTVLTLARLVPPSSSPSSAARLALHLATRRRSVHRAAHDAARTSSPATRQPRVRPPPRPHLHLAPAQHELHFGPVHERALPHVARGTRPQLPRPDGRLDQQERARGAVRRPRRDPAPRRGAARGARAQGQGRRPAVRRDRVVQHRQPAAARPEAPHVPAPGELLLFPLELLARLNLALAPCPASVRAPAGR